MQLKPTATFIPLSTAACPLFLTAFQGRHGNQASNLLGQSERPHSWRSNIRRRPDGNAGDDGVLLSVVLDGFKGTNYLLCPDAKTTIELGRAECEGAIGLGFHGTHISSNGSGVGGG